jgi:hypothetical protein
MAESFDYPRLLQRALRTLVREVLTVTASEGLPGEHHFYISLRTDRPDVRMPPFLRQRYPEEMTVVLQNQFWDLQVDDDRFGVTLRFDGMQARVEVPFDAVVAFFDPAAQFGLRFDLAGLGGATPTAAAGDAAASGPREIAAESPEGGTDAGDEPAGAEGAAEPTSEPSAPTNGNGKGAGEGKVLSFDRARERREPEEE